MSEPVTTTPTTPPETAATEKKPTKPHVPLWMTDGRTGPVRRFRNQLAFACEGIVVIISERADNAGDHKLVPPKVLRYRIEGMRRLSREKNIMSLPEWQRKQHQKDISQLQDLLECIREAEAMGDPTDDNVQAWWARHGHPLNPTTIAADASAERAAADAAFYATVPPLAVPGRQPPRIMTSRTE